MSKVTEKKINPLAQRSKELLTDSFFQLLKEHPRKRIQVKELCERANVARPTFYAHFEEVEDILREYIDNCCEEMIDLTLENTNKGYSPQSQIYSHLEKEYKVWGDHAELFLLVHMSGMENIIIDKMRKISEFMLKMSVQK